MPKFGRVHFNEDYFGDGRLNQVFRKKSFKHIPLGLTVRGTIGRFSGDTSQAIIYRRRRGNGYYGATLNHIYQDKYKYFANDPNAANCPDAAKSCFAAAVAAWPGLSEAEKKKWNRLATSAYKMPGRNLFISRYMKENYP